MKSFLANAQNVEHKWLLVDATDLVLGRMSAKVAALLRGKHKPTFTPETSIPGILSSSLTPRR